MDTLREWLSPESIHPALGPLMGAILLLAVLVLRFGLRRTRIGRRLDSVMTLIFIGLVLGEIAARARTAPGCS
jgi:hypothetical protein